ncbi:hypothetical protein CSB37_03240 [bacterium DOLZORAL124_38_8]|nr:MAG: hypothetical protein CSB37_03240 [bacterium DOLZORAL124_38_8]
MIRRNNLWGAFVQILLDAFSVFGALLLAYFIRMDWGNGTWFDTAGTLIPLGQHVELSLIITGAILFVFFLRGRYELEFSKKPSDKIWETFWAYSSGFSLVLVGFFFFKYTFFSRLIFGLAWAFGLGFIYVFSWIWYQIRKIIWWSGFGRIQVLVLGTQKLGKQISKILEDFPQYNVLASVPQTRFEKLDELILKYNPDEIFLASEELESAKVARLAHITHTNHKKFHLIPNELALDLAGVEVSALQKMPLLTLRSTNLDSWGGVFKTLFDKGFSLLALLLLSPIMLTVAFFVWLEDRKTSVIYRSHRVGRNGELFECLKFRSMVSGADKQKEQLKAQNERGGDVLFKMKNDPRITPFGKFIRKWSLDELPQFWNVLVGDMSLIGPRPHLPEEIQKYSALQRYLLTIKPGLTGLTAVSPNKGSFENEMKQELFYLKHWSFWLDIKIFFQTIWVVIRGGNY